MKIKNALPWITILAVLKVLLDHWLSLPEEDRHRIGRVVRESKGIPGRITPEHRDHIKQAASQLDKAGLGRDILSATAPLPGRRKNKGS